MIANSAPTDNLPTWYSRKKRKASHRSPFNLELMDGFEPSTSPLPRVCSTPELHEHILLATRTRQHRQLERAAGIEPASSAWKAEVLPLNYARLPTYPAEPSTLTDHALD